MLSLEQSNQNGQLSLEDLLLKSSTLSFGRAANFEPKGYDVTCVKILLIFQALELMIKLLFCGTNLGFFIELL